MDTTIRVLLAAAVLASALTAGSAEAGRPCRRLCRRVIAENVAEHCAPYTGRIKRLCRTDVRTTIIGFCKRQSSGNCLGN
jgi:hypothetical protein